MKKIYLDYAATSPVKKEVLKAMMPYFTHEFGNASSIHSFGREAKIAIEKSRKIIADFLNCNPKEIIFTSGGTESDNLAIRGLIEEIYYSYENFKPHIITSVFEHHAIIDTCRDLEEKGLAEVTYVKPDAKGIISVESIKKAIKKNTVLISIMYVNNEIGTVQPIAEIAEAISGHKPHATSHPLIFHTDAVQAIECQNCDVKKIGVDMLSLSAHKFGGPKGIGALFTKKGVKLHKQNIGGGQENHLRGGTYNTSGIVGMGKAIEELRITNYESRNKKITKLRDYFIQRILKEIPDTFLNGDEIKRNPNNVNISFKYIEGEAILLHLDAKGIAASSGSACTSGNLEPSHVLLSIGLRHEDAHGSIRFTLGNKITKEDIDYVVDNLKKIVQKLREMSPFGK
jgi:cysteine desulfurase